MITREDLSRLERHEAAALDLWKACAREWHRVIRNTIDAWVEEVGMPDRTNILMVQANMKRAGGAWAAVDEDLVRARAIFAKQEADAGSPINVEGQSVAVSRDPSSRCRCYSMRTSSGELEGVLDPECGIHGANRAIA